MVLERINAPLTLEERSRPSPDAPPLTVEDAWHLDDEVERLLAIAVQLFALVERQIHLIESGYAATRDAGGRSNGQTIFKETLIHSAAGLDTSLHEIAGRLADWAVGMNEQLRRRSVESLEWF